MKEVSKTPKVISFNSAISACEKCSEWQMALELLAALPAAHLEADGITFNAALSACDRGAFASLL